MSEQEVRLAVVMNGGVSLAVWMAGVSHELDLVRRATTPDAPEPRGEDKKVSQQWQLMNPEGQRRRRLVIDVVAGTSAGGLNGAMLANAIAHNGTLDPDRPDKGGVDHVIPEDATGPWLREVWCHLGELRQDRLLPLEPSKRIGSLLNGEFFEENLKRVMRRISASAAGAPGADGNPHQPVTLFTTASGLGVQQFTATDAAGQEFEVADHRFLYRFTTDRLPTYDEHERTFHAAAKDCCDFADPDTLGEAARASASFPVAFRAQKEPRALKCLPPRMRPQRASANSTWLMDGGVLDNAPFGPVLDTIAKGSVAGDVKRLLIYVVPSVGIGANLTKIDDEATTAPGWFPTLLSAIKYPREVDFRSDIEDLQRLREEADASWSDAQTLFEQAVADERTKASLLEAAKLLQPTYARGRAAGGVWETMIVGSSGQVTSLDKATAAPLEKADEILATEPSWTPKVGHAIQTLVNSETESAEWPWGLGPAERVVRTVLRSTRTALKKEAEIATEVNQEQIQRLEDQLRDLSVSLRHVLALRDRVEAVLREDFQKLDSQTVDKVAELINATFKNLGVRQTLGSEIARLQHLPDLKDRLETAMAVEVVSRCTSSRTPDQRSAPFDFVRLGPDASLPMLSEEDQALAKNLGNNILYGTQAGNFGAFGANDWRRWDWLMGRLHAAAHLGMLLYDSSSTSQPPDATEWVKSIQMAICTAEGFTVERVHKKLQELQTTVADTRVRMGVARMLDAMNEADQKRPAHEWATVHVGDRVVAASAAARQEVKSWLPSLIGRTPGPEVSQLQRWARWFLAPTRTHIWQRLTGQPQPSEPESAMLLLADQRPWELTLIGGAALVGASVELSLGRSRMRSLLVAYLAGAILLAGGLGLGLTELLMKWQSGLNTKLTEEFDKLLPATTTAEADK